MRLVFQIIMFLSIVQGIQKKKISINKKYDTPINAQEVKLSEVDLALYQYDMQQIGQKNHLKSEISNWIKLSYFYNSFELYLSKQQQIGIILVCMICFAFYLMVKSEDRNMKQRNQNTKSKQKNYYQQDAIVQILTESLLAKEQFQLPLVSTINGSIHFEERVNKSADQMKNNEPFIQFKRSNSQPIIQINISDYSSEEINSLLKDIN